MFYFTNFSKKIFSYNDYSYYKTEDEEMDDGLN